MTVIFYRFFALVLANLTVHQEVIYRFGEEHGLQYTAFPARSMQRITILDVPIDCVAMPSAIERIRALLADGKKCLVTTPNPEMLVEATRNPSFRTVLQSATLALPDGYGLLLVSRMMGKRIPHRVTGTDTMIALCGLSPSPKIFLLGAAEGVAAAAARVLCVRHPHLQIVGTFSGSPEPANDTAITHRINASGATLLFVAFGAPTQELWIARNLPRLTSVRVAMGVGGAFDFVAGKRRRAPVFVQSLHLEWLWRLLQEPSRVLRIWRAVIVFPMLVLTEDRRSLYRRR